MGGIGVIHDGERFVSHIDGRVLDATREARTTGRVPDRTSSACPIADTNPNNNGYRCGNRAVTDKGVCVDFTSCAWYNFRGKL